jgi:uncharacterized membrane protein YphA (DoxX/SURF4 family)
MPSSTSTQNALSLVGRLLIGWLFIPSGWAKIGAFLAVTGYLAAKGVPFPEACAAIAISAELALGVLVLAGWQARWAAVGLAAYVAVITPDTLTEEGMMGSPPVASAISTALEALHIAVSGRHAEQGPPFPVSW